MNDRKPDRFKLSPRGALLAVVSAALANSALANTGRVDFTIGNVNMTNADGRVQPLAKGTEVKSGDKITSGADGRTQIRFSDGAYVSLQPDTEFDIKEYRYNGKTDGTESAVFGLFKGALRTVTGLVGRVNRNKYQITTPSATIGIRGTGGLVQIGADGSTLVTGTSGIWSLTNNSGTLNIPAGTSGFAGANQNLPPQRAAEGPVVPPAPPTVQTQPVYTQGDQRTAQGSIFIPLQSGTGYAIGSGVSSTTTSATDPFIATFNSSGQLTDFKFDTSSSVTFLAAPVDVLVVSAPTIITSGSLTDGGSHADFGTEAGILAWGRWIGNMVLNGSAFTLDANQGFHYVIGMPTPVANMPTSGTFTYSLISTNPISATQPTFTNGATAPGTLTSATLSGDFATGSMTANVSAVAGGLKFDGAATGLVNNVFNLTGGAGTGTGCVNNACTFRAGGFFAGNNASLAGITYSFGNTTLVSDLTGAAALKRQ